MMRARPQLLSIVLLAWPAVFVGPAAPDETAQGAGSQRSSGATATAARPLGFPVGFEPAAGASFRSRAGGYEIRLDAAGVSFIERLPGALSSNLVLRMVPTGARAERVPVGEDVLPGAVNYLLGADPASWQTAVPRFAVVRVADTYPGIDWLFRAVGGVIEYDFIVAPGADAAQIRLRLEGAGAVTLDDEGNLRVHAGTAELVHSAPLIYQQRAGRRHRIDGGFTVDASSGEIGFWLGDYDAGRELVIDPAIGFSSYFGGVASEDLPRIALGPDGSIFLVGTTASPDLPAGVASGTGAPFAAALSGDVDAFVAKLDPSGSRLEFVTYVGGSGMDRGGGVVVADDGAVWISGQTTSVDFPVTDGAFGGAADAFVVRISADGAAVEFGAFIGGGGVESGTGIARDEDGFIYLTGNTASADFATTAAAQAALGGPSDAFVVKLDPSGRETLYSTYVGGAAGDDAGFDIAADASGNAYVTGSTESADFPTVTPLQPGYGGSGDAFVVKLSRSGEVQYATTLGGSGADAGLAIDVDSSGAAYVTGQSESADFPTRNPFQRLPGGGPDAFVTKIAADGRSVDYSTFLGGSGVDVGADIAVDGAGNAHVTGMTASPDFPTVDSLQPFFGGGSDVFVSRLNDLGSALTYSTFSGGSGGEAGIGIAVDGAGNAYVAGQTSSDDFPTFNPVQPELRGSQDAFVTKYCLSLVFPEEREFASGAGGDSFAVTTAAGCVWIAFSQAPWITLTSPNVVAGAGDVQFAVAPNASGAPRSGILNIAGTQVTVLQTAATDCEYEVFPASENFYMIGGVGRINVNTRDDCAWIATTRETWISISGGDKGTGSGVVSYTVEANGTGRQRSGSIIVAGQTFVVFDWLREPGR